MNTNGFTQQEYEAASNIALPSLVELLGYHLKQTGDSTFRVQEMDSIEINTQSNSFYRHSLGIGGGPVQFMQMTQGLNVAEAVHAIYNAANTPALCKTPAREPPKTVLKKPFALPPRAQQHRHVFAYLNQKRGIAAEVISEMMHQRRVYETVFHYHQTEHFNCVFVGMDSEQNPVHAATRFARDSDQKSWRVVSGSNSQYPFSMPGHNQTLCVYESAIDALSGATFDLLLDKDWRDDHRIALGGLSHKPLERYLQEHSEVRRLVLCLDNDLGSVAKGEENHGQVKAAQLSKRFNAQGYVVETLVPRQKDMNAALQAFMQSQQQPVSQEEDEWDMER